MEIDPLPKRLDAGHNTRAKLCAGDGLEVMEEGLDGCLTELAEKPPFVFEEYAQHLWNDEDDLMVRNI